MENTPHRTLWAGPRRIQEFSQSSQFSQPSQDSQIPESHDDDLDMERAARIERIEAALARAPKGQDLDTGITFRKAPPKPRVQILPNVMNPPGDLDPPQDLSWQMHERMEETRMEEEPVVREVPMTVNRRVITRAAPIRSEDEDENEAVSEKNHYKCVQKNMYNALVNSVNMLAKRMEDYEVMVGEQKSNLESEIRVAIDRAVYDLRNNDPQKGLICSIQSGLDFNKNQFTSMQEMFMKDWAELKAENQELKTTFTSGTERLKEEILANIDSLAVSLDQKNKHIINSFREEMQKGMENRTETHNTMMRNAVQNIIANADVSIYINRALEEMKRTMSEAQIAFCQEKFRKLQVDIKCAEERMSKQANQIKSEMLISQKTDNKEFLTEIHRLNGNLKDDLWKAREELINHSHRMDRQDGNMKAAYDQLRAELKTYEENTRRWFQKEHSTLVDLIQENEKTIADPRNFHRDLLFPKAWLRVVKGSLLTYPEWMQANLQRVFNLDVLSQDEGKIAAHPAYKEYRTMRQFKGNCIPIPCEWAKMLEFSQDEAERIEEMVKVMQWRIVDQKTARMIREAFAKWGIVALTGGPQIAYKVTFLSYNPCYESLNGGVTEESWFERLVKRAGSLGLSMKQVEDKSGRLKFKIGHAGGGGVRLKRKEPTDLSQFYRPSHAPDQGQNDEAAEGFIEPRRKGVFEPLPLKSGFSKNREPIKKASREEGTARKRRNITGITEEEGTLVIETEEIYLPPQ